jgi:hypothetical protein
MVMEASGSALVAGSGASKSAEPILVKILRSFYFAGAPLAVGTVLELPRGFAREQMSYGRCVVTEVEEKPKREAKKEKSDAE